MMMGLLVILMIASIPLTGGRLRQVLHLPVKVAWLLPVALFLQVLVISIAPNTPEPIPIIVHLLTYVLAGVFLFFNRHIAGLAILALGGAMNGIAIAANHGSLPASAAALRRAGWNTSGTEFMNSQVLKHPHLAWLGDNFAIPAGVPFANVFSLGDVVILLGAMVILHRGSRVPEVPPGPAIIVVKRAGRTGPERQSVGASASVHDPRPRS